MIYILFLIDKIKKMILEFNEWLNESKIITLGDDKAYDKYKEKKNGPKVMFKIGSTPVKIDKATINMSGNKQNIHIEFDNNDTIEYYYDLDGNLKETEYIKLNGKELKNYEQILYKYLGKVAGGWIAMLSKVYKDLKNKK